MISRPMIDRVIDLVVRDGNGCWIFEGNRNAYGYGRIRRGKGQRGTAMVHRVVYEHFVGPIPDGLQLDHLCRVRACCNPEHLEPVTTQENVLRGNGVSAVNARKTHCIHGHPFDDLNTCTDPTWGRKCRTCARTRAAMYRADKRYAS